MDEKRKPSTDIQKKQPTKAQKDSELDTSRLTEPEKPPNQGKLVATSHEITISGPIPSGTEMEIYKKVDPKFPDRIMSMAEKEQSHRQNMEKERMEINKKLANRSVAITSRGQWLAFSFGLCLLGLLVLLISLDADTWVTIALIASMAGLIGLFVKKAYFQKNSHSTAK